MALETGTFISDLVATNPVGSDPLAFADDHIRLVKSTIKNTFPNVSGAVTKTHTEINTAVDQAAAALPRAGGTMTGAITLAGNASADLHAVPRQQVISLIQAMYPVGSVYINASSTANPSVLLGFGTWVEFGAGRVMVGQNASDTLFDTLEETGGSKDAIVVSHTHTGTTASDGVHTHTFNVNDAGGRFQATGSPGTFAGVSNTTDPAGAHTHTFTTNSTGSSGTNANLPPYIVVKMWKRTA